MRGDLSATSSFTSARPGSASERPGWGAAGRTGSFTGLERPPPGPGSAARLHPPEARSQQARSACSVFIVLGSAQAPGWVHAWAALQDFASSEPLSAGHPLDMGRHATYTLTCCFILFFSPVVVVLLLLVLVC